MWQGPVEFRDDLLDGSGEPQQRIAGPIRRGDQPSDGLVAAYVSSPPTPIAVVCPEVQALFEAREADLAPAPGTASGMAAIQPGLGDYSARLIWVETPVVVGDEAVVGLVNSSGFMGGASIILHYRRIDGRWMRTGSVGYISML